MTIEKNETKDMEIAYWHVWQCRIDCSQHADTLKIIRNFYYQKYIF